MIKRQNTQSIIVLLASCKILMTIFSRLLSVCLLLVIPQNCTIQIQLWSRGKPSPFLFFLHFVNYMHRVKFETLLSICLLQSSLRTVLYKFSYDQEAKHLVHLCFCLLISLNHNPYSLASCELHLLAVIFLQIFVGLASVSHHLGMN